MIHRFKIEMHVPAGQAAHCAHLMANGRIQAIVQCKEHPEDLIAIARADTLADMARLMYDLANPDASPATPAEAIAWMEKQEPVKEQGFAFHRYVHRDNLTGCAFEYTRAVTTAEPGMVPALMHSGLSTGESRNTVRCGRGRAAHRRVPADHLYVPSGNGQCAAELYDGTFCKAPRGDHRPHVTGERPL